MPVNGSLIAEPYPDARTPEEIEADFLAAQDYARPLAAPPPPAYDPVAMGNYDYQPPPFDPNAFAPPPIDYGQDLAAQDYAQPMSQPGYEIGASALAEGDIDPFTGLPILPWEPFNGRTQQNFERLYQNAGEYGAMIPPGVSQSIYGAFGNRNLPDPLALPEGLSRPSDVLDFTVLDDLGGGFKYVQFPEGVTGFVDVGGRIVSPSEAEAGATRAGDIQAASTKALGAVASIAGPRTGPPSGSAASLAYPTGTGRRVEDRKEAARQTLIDIGVDPAILDYSPTTQGRIGNAVVDIRGDRVHLGIEAPVKIPVHREEIFLEIQRARDAEEGTAA